VARYGTVVQPSGQSSSWVRVGPLERSVGPAPLHSVGPGPLSSDGLAARIERPCRVAHRCCRPRWGRVTRLACRRRTPSGLTVAGRRSGLGVTCLSFWTRRCGVTRLVGSRSLSRALLVHRASQFVAGRLDAGRLAGCGAVLCCRPCPALRPDIGVAFLVAAADCVTVSTSTFGSSGRGCSGCCGHEARSRPWMCKTGLPDRRARDRGAGSAVVGLGPVTRIGLGIAGQLALGG